MVGNYANNFLIESAASLDPGFSIGGTFLSVIITAKTVSFNLISQPSDSLHFL